MHLAKKWCVNEHNDTWAVQKKVDVKKKFLTDFIIKCLKSCNSVMSCDSK